MVIIGRNQTKNQRKEKGLKVRVEKDNLIDNELETYVADSDSY